MLIYNRCWKQFCCLIFFGILHFSRFFDKTLRAVFIQNINVVFQYALLFKSCITWILHCKSLWIKASDKCKCIYTVYIIVKYKFYFGLLFITHLFTIKYFILISAFSTQFASLQRKYLNQQFNSQWSFWSYTVQVSDFCGVNIFILFWF